MRFLYLLAILLALASVGVAQLEQVPPSTGKASSDKSATGLSSLPTDARGAILAALAKDGALDPLDAGLWIQQAELSASDGAIGNDFGAVVAVSGSTVVVGAPDHTVGTNGYQGAAYVFVESGGTWTQQAELTASDGAAGDQFGTVVAVSGGTVLVGAIGHPSTGIGNYGPGAAYIFVQSGTTWSQQAELTASDGAAQDFFGYSAAVSGSTAMVGAPSHKVGSNTDQGAAYVFVQSGTTWSQEAELTASDGASGDEFGNSIAVSGSTAVVGAADHKVGSNYDQGAAYVFVENGASWSQQAELTASDGDPQDYFGYSVAVDGSTAVVGAVYHPDGNSVGPGAAYLFVQGGTTWSQQAELTPSDGLAWDFFGCSAAVSGSTVVVGAYGHPAVAAGDYGPGAAYVFVESGETWSQQAELTASDGAASDNFGNSVAISGSSVGVGAPWHTIGSNTHQGAGYMFEESSAPNYTLSASPSSVSVQQSGQGTSTITIMPVNGFSGNVSFSASGLPSGVSAAFSQNPATSTSTLTLTVSGTAAVGTTTVTVTGTSGSLSQTTALTLTVVGPSFTLSASPGSLSVLEGVQGISTITITPLYGFNGSVSLSASGLPSGVTAAFNPNPGTSTSTLTLTASGTATTGTTTVTVTGTSGSLTETTLLSLTVTSLGSGGIQTTLTSSPNPSTYEEEVVFYVGVNVTFNESPPPVEEGTVSLYGGSTALGMATWGSCYVPDVVGPGGTTEDCVATLSTPALPVGTTAITAVYYPYGGFSGSTSNVVDQVVTSSTAATTTTALASSLSPSLYGQSVTFTATITSETGSVTGRRPADKKRNVVSGSVTWSANTGCGTTNVMNGYPGAATCTTSSLGTGSDTVTATYSGDANHNGSVGTLSQVVNPAANTVTFTTPAPVSAEYGSSFTVAATGLGTGAIIYTSDGVVCTNSGATYTMIAGAGTCVVTATQAADSNHVSGYTSALVPATNANSSVSVASSGPSTYGEAVTFTATITSDADAVKGRRNTAKKPKVISGSVTWSTNTGCGTTTVTAGYPGTATCATSILSVGNDTITATYSGDNNHSGGSSGSINQTVTGNLGTTIGVASVSPWSEDYGSTTTVTITVVLSWTNNGGAAPTASDVSIGGTGLSGSFGTTTCGGASGGTITCIATYTPSGMEAAGSYTMTAAFAGDANYAASDSTQTNNFAITPANASVSLASSLSPSTYGQPVTFTATITSDTGAVKGRRTTKRPRDLNGQIRWSANTGCSATPVSGNPPQTATCTTSTLGFGGDTVTATYTASDSNHTTASGSVSQTVNQASQTITFTTAAPSSAAYISNFTVAASASSGLAVAYTSAGSCSNAGAIYTMTSGSGTCFVIANQAGNANYIAASQVTESTNATQLPQIITCNPPPVVVVNSSFNLACSTTSGEPVVFSSSGDCTSVGGNTFLAGKTVGLCLVTVDATGNGNYAPPPPVAISMSVVKEIKPTVTFTGAPATAPYQSTFAVATTSNSPSTPTITATPSTVCTINGNMVTMTSGTGTCTLTAKWAASGAYLAATATQRATAEKVASGLTWATPAPITYGTKLTSIQLDATANVAGKFVYSPAAGTKPQVPIPPATCDTLKVTFIPTQTADCNKETATVCLEVSP